MEKVKLSLVLLAILCVFAGCAATQKPPTVAQFRFEYNGENYRIRSIHSENESDSRNEIIGGRFMAVDFDKDKIVDSIVLGGAQLIEAQIVYDYGLEKLSKENKLSRQDVKNGRFVFTHNELYIEIKTFSIENAKPFNEFKIKEKRQLNPSVYAFLDVDADGKLDKVLKGGCATNEYQVMYSEAINAGLQVGQLIKRNNMVVVKGH